MISHNLETVKDRR